MTKCPISKQTLPSNDLKKVLKQNPPQNALSFGPLSCITIPTQMLSLDDAPI